MGGGLLERTRAVWSKSIGRDVGEDEAAEILTRVARLAQRVRETLKDGKEDGQ